MSIQSLERKFEAFRWRFTLDCGHTLCPGYTKKKDCFYCIGCYEPVEYILDKKDKEILNREEFERKFNSHI